jgi:TolB protein
MSDRDGDFEVFTMPVSGRWVQQLTGWVQQLTDNAARDGLPQWSPDGSQILFTSNRDGNYELRR